MADAPAGEQKPIFNEEQLEAINRIVNKTVNGAVSTIKKQFETVSTETKDSIAKLLDERLQSLKPADKDEGDKDGGGKRGKRGDDVEFQTLKKELSELRTQAEDARRIANEERGKSRMMNLRAAAGDELAKLGITGNHARLALSVLLQEERISWDTDAGVGEADELVFKSDEEGWVKLSSGLKTWAKSPDAKIFLPPSGAQGAGSRPVGTAPQTPVQLTDAERKQMLGKMLDQALT